MDEEADLYRIQGDTFSAGDVLLEIETDKAQMDVEAQDEGILAKIIVTTPGAQYRLCSKADLPYSNPMAPRVLKSERALL